MRVLLLSLAALAVAAPALAQDPPPTDFDQVVRAHLATTLADPSSAVVILKRAPRWATFDAATSKFTGWTVCYSVNAKNAYGAFVGARDLVFVLRGGHVAHMNGYAGDRWIADQIRAECAKPADQPAAAKTAL